jgi:Tol biopolymer transport system component
LRPQGDWILLRVEGAGGPLINQSSTAQLQVIRNNGYYSNLWVTNPAGSQWYQLTQFTAPPGGNPGAYGELGPQWSPDGTMVMFSETYEAPDQANLQGYWHLYLANFAVDSATGVPSFSNVTDITLPGDVFNEPQAFSPDGTQLVVQSYTPGVNAYGVDLYAVNLVQGPNFGQYTDITNSPYSWDEHAEFSPDGQKIAYISSLPFPNIIPEYGTLMWADYRTYLHTEMFLMNSDGTGVQQLTYFNTPSSPEYTPQFADAMFPTWSLDGSQLLIRMGTADDPVPGGNSNWMVNFQGACGGQASQ